MAPRAHCPAGSPRVLAIPCGAVPMGRAIADFDAVGSYYDSFPQVDDAEVIAILARRGRPDSSASQGNGSPPDEEPS